MGVSLLFINAVAGRSATARTEVRLPSALISLGENDEGFAFSLEEETRSFDSDRVTRSISAAYRGTLDAEIATARPKQDSDSVLVIEVEGGPAVEARDLAETAAATFADVRRSTQLNALSARIEVLSERSDDLWDEIEQLVELDFAARADPVASDDLTAIAALVEPLAADYAELSTRVGDYETTLRLVENDGYEFTATLELTQAPPLMSTTALIGAVLIAVLAGAAAAVALGLHEQAEDVSPSMRVPDEFESDPLAWVDALRGEPDGVFIDVDYAAPRPGSVFAELEEIDLRSETANEGTTPTQQAAAQFFSASHAPGSN